MTIISLRNSILRLSYKYILKPFFFRRDPEKVHDRMVHTGVLLGKAKLTRLLTKALFSYSSPLLRQNILGIKFANPIGLAAGFDKDAILTDIMPAVGFGFEEVGSITGEPCSGNEGTRLWRLKKSQSLLVYYGLKNRGCEIIYQELKNKQFAFPVGISVAKTNNQETIDKDAGIADYVKAYTRFKDIGAYTTINISCPNTFGGQPFTDPASLDELLKQIDPIPSSKPIFIKFSPDISLEQVDAILKVIDSHKVHGIICSNLTKNRNNHKILDSNFPEVGGMSGKIVEDMANEHIKYVYKKTQGRYIIIGLGGVFNAEDAYKKIRLGASLVQLITGMIYQGPQLISDINYGLVKLLKKDGFTNISQAIGVDNR